MVSPVSHPTMARTMPRMIKRVSLLRTAGIEGPPGRKRHPRDGHDVLRRERPERDLREVLHGGAPRSGDLRQRAIPRRDVTVRPGLGQEACDPVVKLRGGAVESVGVGAVPCPELPECPPRSEEHTSELQSPCD